MYAVGDIHGRSDLFRTLVAAIDADDDARAPARTTVILLGDLVDRGPDSAGVLRLARDWQARRPVRILAGNHEEMFLSSFGGGEELRRFLRVGGRETVLSYPIDPAELTAASIEEARELMRCAIPQEDLDFIAGFEDAIVVGDYLFVHAGIRPDVPLADQDTADLRWIRAPFLDSREPFAQIVVHGHTIFEKPDVRPNRIGIDTGAFLSGRLTALCLEGKDRWVLETMVGDDVVTCALRSLS